jgi:SPOR domain
MLGKDVLVADFDHINIAAELLKDNFFSDDVMVAGQESQATAASDQLFGDSAAANAGVAAEEPLFGGATDTAGQAGAADQFLGGAEQQPSESMFDQAPQPETANSLFGDQQATAGSAEATANGASNLTSLIDEATPEPAASAAAPASTLIAPEPIAATAAAVAPAAQQGSKKGLIIGIAAGVGVLAIIAVVAVVFLMGGKEQAPATPTAAETIKVAPEEAPVEVAAEGEAEAAAEGEEPVVEAEAAVEEPAAAPVAPPPARTAKVAQPVAAPPVAAPQPVQRKTAPAPAPAPVRAAPTPAPVVAPVAPARPATPQFKLKINKTYDNETEAAIDRAMLNGLGYNARQQSVQAPGGSSYSVSISKRFDQAAKARVATVKLDIFGVPSSIRENSDGSATVSIGTYTDETKANNMKSKASNAGYPASVSRRSTNVTKYKLTAGKFYTRGEAESALARVRGRGIDATIVGY